MPCAVSLDLVQLGVVETGRDVAFGFVHGGVDQGVRKAEILAGQLLLEGDRLAAPSLVAVNAPFVAATGEAGVGHVHIVGGATHQSNRELGDPAQRLVPAQTGPRGSGG